MGKLANVHCAIKLALARNAKGRYR